MAFRIPLFDLNFDEREERAVVETLRSKWISTGPRTEQLESMFARMLDAKHGVALSNCTVALHLAMRLLGIVPEDEVICPSLTFVATVNAIKYAGATPVFCDVTSIDEPTIDPAEIERAVTARTKAIMVMHYAGFPCRMDEILAIAQRHNIRVIEDACHGPLTEYGGRKLGTLGDVGCFSFFSNKNISTGEGGMIVVNDDELAAQARLLRSHGMTTISYDRARGHSTQYDVVDLGYNYRLDDIRASIGIVQLEKLADDLQQRRTIRASYIDALSGMAGIAIPFRDHENFVSNYIFPIVLTGSTEVKRERVRASLHRAGIQTSVHYPAVHRFSIYEKERRSLPATEYCTDNEITLPMYSKLTTDDIAFIASSLQSALDENLDTH